MGIVLSLPLYLLENIHFDEVVYTTYKAKCNSNNQYVVLEGSQPNDYYIFDKITLNDNTFSDTKKDLNFYCQNYDEIQPYIIDYVNSKTNEERINVNKDFFTFKENVYSNVYSYPPTYQLEVVDSEIIPYKIYGPIINWLIGAIIIFIILQVVRICYVYVVFGKVVWHPFRKI